MGMSGKVRKNFLLIVFLLLQLICRAGGFEGSIFLIKESCYDTAFLKYYVSDGKIRIEELNSKKLLQHIYIINTVNDEVFIIDPVKKLYTKLRKKSQNFSNNDGQCTILKSQDSRFINGIRCYQWRVKCREKNTEIAYWVTQNDFYFFEKMAKILNSAERSMEFFTHIPLSQGFFPMLCVERNLVRDEKMRTAVLNIERKVVDSSLFSIPMNYKLYVI